MFDCFSCAYRAANDFDKIFQGTKMQKSKHVSSKSKPSPSLLKQISKLTEEASQACP